MPHAESKTQHTLVKTAFMMVFLLLSAPATAKENVSGLHDDDHLVFFRTSAWLDTQTDTWHLPIHGWIYEPQESQYRKGAIATVLRQRFDLRVNSGTEANFDRRVNLMLADNERGKQAVIQIGGRVHTLPESGPNGHFETTIMIPASEIEHIARGNIVSYSTVISSRDQRVFSGQVCLVPPAGISVISDIDDTIKISFVTDHAKLFDYSFFRDFEAVPGMAALYRDWSRIGTAVHLVSSSPWQFYEPLLEFAEMAEFPWASLHLKMIRMRDQTVLNVFKPGTETKPLQIKPLLARYPGRRFILIGDSGEKDPEVYARIFLEHPEQIERIYIRNVTSAARDDSRFASLFDGIPADRWMLFEDASVLELPKVQ